MKLQQLTDRFYQASGQAAAMINSFAAAISGECPPDEGQVSLMTQALLDLRRSYEEVREYAARTLTAEEMPQQESPIRVYCEAIFNSCRVANERVLRMFLSIQTQENRYQAELERVQKHVQELLAAFERDEGIEESLTPYSAFVQGVRLGPDAFENEEEQAVAVLDTLEESPLSFKLVSGMMKGAFTLEESEAPQWQPQQIPAMATQEENMAAVAPVSVQASEVQEQPAPIVEKQSAPVVEEEPVIEEEVILPPEKLWPESASYCEPGDCEVTIVHAGKPGKSVDANSLKDFVKNNTDARWDDLEWLIEIANSLLLDVDSITDQAARDKILPPSWPLHAAGYVDLVKIRRGETEKQYFCLSDASRFMLADKRAFKFLKEGKRTVLRAIRPNGYISSSMITDVYACRLLDMLEHVRCTGKTFLPVSETVMNVGAMWPARDKRKVCLTMALFKAGTEAEDVDWLRDAAQRAFNANGRLTVLTVSEEETHHVKRALDLSDELEGRVDFVVAGSVQMEEEPEPEPQPEPVEETEAPQETPVLASVQTEAAVAQEAPAPVEPAEKQPEQPAAPETAQSAETAVAQEEAPAAEETGNSVTMTCCICSLIVKAAADAEQVECPACCTVMDGRGRILWSPIRRRKAFQDLERNMRLSTAERDRFVSLAISAYGNDRGDVGSTMLRSLSQTHPEIDVLWQRWACADNDPAWAGDSTRKPTQLQSVYAEPGEGSMADNALAVAAYLRMYFSDDAGSESWVRSAPLVRDYLKTLPGAYQVLNESVQEIDQLVQNTQSGITTAVLDELCKRQANAAVFAELRTRARDKLSGKLEESGIANKRVGKLYAELLGRTKVICTALEYVLEDGFEAAEMVEDSINDLHAGLLGEKLDREIENLMDKVWDTIPCSDHDDNLKGNARNNLKCRLRDCMDIIRTWLSQVKKMGMQQVSAEALRRGHILRDKLPLALEEVTVGKEMAPDEVLRAAMRVLENTLSAFCDALNGLDKLGERKKYYLALAAENAVFIEEGGLPAVFSVNELVEPYEQCRRLEPFCAAEKPDPVAAANAFIANSVSSFPLDKCGGNYGNGEYLLRCVPAEALDAYSDARLTYNNTSGALLLLQEIGRFRGQMEMADAYGWFENAAEGQEIIERAVINQCESCSSTHNYQLGLECMQNAAHWVRMRARENWVALLESRLNQAMIKHGVTEEHAVVRRARKLMRNDSFHAADSVIRAAAVNGFQEESANPHGDWVFGHFSNEAVNEQYYLDTKTIRNTSLLSVFERTSRTRVRGTEQRTGAAFLQKWPESPQNMYNNAADLLKGLDLNVANVVKFTDAKGNTDSAHAVVTFHPQKRSWDYAHPIANFGTLMYEKGLHVICIPSALDARGYFERIRECINTCGNAQAVMIVINAALPLNMRRTIASMIWHELNAATPFIFIDRMLALYLAERPKEMRWNYLLQCALPFARIRPYANGDKVQPPEMFVGRRKELLDIAAFVSDGGASIVYGGRQLGKTALLRRVKQQYHDPENNSYAVVCDIKDKDAVSAVPHIVQALREHGIPGAEDIPLDTTWEKMCWALREMMHRNPQMRLRLMVDEADELLFTAKDNAYRILDNIKEVQDIYNDRFKFVLAGLHNVMRFHEEASDENSSLPKLGHVCVLPLPFADAETLLKKPLSYLGFEFIEADGQGGNDPERYEQAEAQQALISMILSTTNYYPGLIHFYCRNLLESLGEGQTNYASSQPPYKLDEKLILHLLQNEEFKQETKNKFLMTIGVDKTQYYSILAYLMAYCFHESSALEGVTVEKLRRVAAYEGIEAVTRLSDQQLTVLLNELCQLNIFRTDDNVYYRFVRAAFLNMLGTQDEVFGKLIGYTEVKEVRN